MNNRGHEGANIKAVKALRNRNRSSSTECGGGKGPLKLLLSGNVPDRDGGGGALEEACRQNPDDQAEKGV